MPGRMDCHGESDVGLRRTTNEDQFLIADLTKSVIIHHTSLSYEDETELRGGSQAKLMLVADGVGGNAAGDRASSLALEGVVQYLLNAMHWLFRPEEDSEERFMEDLKSALSFSQEKIQHAAEAVPSQQGMGTTITMAYIVWPCAYLLHAGASRAYVLRDGEITRLTQDQTMAQDLADAGGFKPEQFHSSPLNHVLSSLVGCDPKQLHPQVYKYQLQLHDTLLLCTDGLTRNLTEPRIADILNEQHSAAWTCRQLIASARAAGGRDNTTVVVARFTDEQSATSEQKTAVASQKVPC